MKKKSKLCALTGFLLLGTLSVGFLTGCDPEVPPIVEFDGYSVNLTFDNTKGNVTASKTSGSQSEEVTITVTPNEHYSVSKVTINNDSKVISSDGTYKFTTIEGDNNVVVEFIGEEVSLEVTQASNGEITYEGDTPLRYGDEVDVTFTPSEGYVLYSYTFNGEEVVSDDESITLALDNYPTNTLTASFILEQTEVSTTLTINTSEHGTVTPSKTEGYVVGEEITLTITPETGYELESLTFNDEEVTPTEGIYKVILVEGENIINATFKEIVESFDTYTIYFKDASWWNSDAASTRINLFKNSELVVDSDAMNYMTNPGYFNGSNYWSYDVNLADYDQVQFLRYNSSGTEKYNETSIIDLSEEYNCYSFVQPDEGDFIIEQSYINVEDILRDEAVINITYNIEDVCVATLSSSTPLVGDTLSISYDMVDGYEIESVTANNVALDNIYQLNVTESTINLVINLVENANIRTIYVQTSTSIRDHQYAPQAYLFLFTEGGGDNGGWPGQQMTFVETLETGERIYSIAGVDITTFEEAIFMIGWADNNCAKTNDLLLSEIGDNNMYVFTDSSDNFVYNGYWTTYSK